MTTYDARYQPPFRINARVRLNPDWAALYPPRVRAQGPGTVGAHMAWERSNIHFDDGSEFPIYDRHLLAATDGEPPAVQPSTPAPAAEPVAQVVCQRTKPARRDVGQCCRDPRRIVWQADPRFWRCANCGVMGKYPTAAAAATLTTTERAR